MFAEHLPLDLMKKIISLILIILLLVGCAFSGISQKEGDNVMNKEGNKAIVLRFVKEVQNQHDVSAMDELFSPDFIDHSGISALPNLEGAKQFFTMFFNAFPDIQVTIHDLCVAEDKVWARKTFHGTHQGEFMGISPTNKSVEINVIDIHRVVDGKITEHWAVGDMLGLMQQLGAIPTSGQTKK